MSKATNEHLGSSDGSSSVSKAMAAAIVSRLAGVGALAPCLYALALEDIASQVGGRGVSEEFKSEVAAILRDIPCPLD